MNFEASRAKALDKLNYFVENNLSEYSKLRNFDYGPDNRSNISCLSPYITHGIINEKEVIKKSLDKFSFAKNEKFIQEVLWRTYWKGWLELRPNVWSDYLIELNKIRKMMKPGGSSGENVEKARALKKRFIDGAVSNGVSLVIAEDLYEKILYFAGYGFNASHAVSYAINSYYCAWLLTHYEEEWVTAYLEAVSGNPKKLAKALSEVKSLGYTVSRVDINKSDRMWVCSDNKTLVPSFSSCKGIGDAAVQEILQNRPYANVLDLLWNEDGSWKHSKLNKRAMSVLIQLRAFETVEQNGQWKNWQETALVYLELLTLKCWYLNLCYLILMNAASDLSMSGIEKTYTGVFVLTQYQRKQKKENIIFC